MVSGTRHQPGQQLPALGSAELTTRLICTGRREPASATPERVGTDAQSPGRVAGGRGARAGARGGMRPPLIPRSRLSGPQQCCIALQSCKLRICASGGFLFRSDVTGKLVSHSMCCRCCHCCRFFSGLFICPCCLHSAPSAAVVLGVSVMQEIPCVFTFRHLFCCHRALPLTRSLP